MTLEMPLEPRFESRGIAIYCGDSLSILRQMPDESVNCCVTSPPYWGLRDYQTASWEGGDAACDHRGRSQTSGTSTLGKWKNGGGQRYKEETGGMPYAGTCGKCGARRIDQQIGLEPIPDEYVAKMVEVFREVRRVLKNDGALFLNLGDSYSRAPEKGGSGPNGKHDYIPSYGDARRLMSESRGSSDGKVGRGDRAALRNGSADLKPKDLVGIPWMVAFALRADGWWLRQDIIWSKKNPLPESVKDRCTKSHEYLFLLTKAERYYFCSDAIAEEAENRGKSVVLGEKSFSKGQANGRGVAPSGNGLASSYLVPEKRNKRSVWEIAIEPFPEAHFATFPTELVKPCVLAGCPTGGVVLDPFCGSGTTLLVARDQGCNGIGIELNPEYIEIASRRLSQEVFDFSGGAT